MRLINDDNNPITLDRHKQLLLEAQALRHFYQVDDLELYTAFNAFAIAWNSREHVTGDQFTGIMDVIDARIEDLCLERKILDTFLEELIEGNEEILKKIRIW